MKFDWCLGVVLFVKNVFLIIEGELRLMECFVYFYFLFFVDLGLFIVEKSE